MRDFDTVGATRCPEHLTPVVCVVQMQEGLAKRAMAIDAPKVLIRFGSNDLAA
ncbi:hypothetical protein IGB42_03948 [Andreprevotia sp. IGB-42]|nr:hypothetical protein IGB42_03948 [Andreprevotia sp. IGB-42]